MRFVEENEGQEKPKKEKHEHEKMWLNSRQPLIIFIEQATYDFETQEVKPNLKQERYNRLK